jgi:hypothetical protein
MYISTNLQDVLINNIHSKSKLFYFFKRRRGQNKTTNFYISCHVMKIHTYILRFATLLMDFAVALSANAVSDKMHYIQ